MSTNSWQYKPMASGKDVKWEEYQEAYEAALREEELRLESNLIFKPDDTVDEDSDTELPLSLNLPIYNLRSGNTYPVRPPRRVLTNQSITPANSIATMPTDPNPNNANPIPLKVLPTEAPVRRYTGEDEGYSARAYLKACEDAMRHAGTTEPADKIAFVRARLAPNSRAERLLQSVAFSAEVTGDDYETFKENFLRVFGGGAGTTLIQQLNQVVERVGDNFRSLDVWDSSIPVHHIPEDCIRILKKENWLESDGESIKTEKLSKFLQIFVFMLHAQDKVSSTALTMNFQPTDQITEFLSKLDVKMRQKEKETGATAVAAASIPSHNDPDPSYVAEVSKKQTVTCDYCHKVGHMAKRCLKRRKDLNITSTKGDWTTKPASGATTPSVRPKTTQRMASVPETSGKTSQTRSFYCAIHGQQTTHSTDRCYNVQRLREEHERKRGSGGRSSGEAARLGGHNPG